MAAAWLEADVPEGCIRLPWAVFYESACDVAAAGRPEGARIKALCDAQGHRDVWLELGASDQRPHVEISLLELAALESFRLAQPAWDGDWDARWRDLDPEARVDLIADAIPEVLAIVKMRFALLLQFDGQSICEFRWFAMRGANQADGPDPDIRTKRQRQRRRTMRMLRLTSG